MAELRPGRPRVGEEAPSQACPLCLCCPWRAFHFAGAQWGLAARESWRKGGTRLLSGPGASVLGGLRGWQCCRPLGLSWSVGQGGTVDVCLVSGLGLWCQPRPREHDPDPEAGKPFGSSLLAGPACGRATGMSREGAAWRGRAGRWEGWGGGSVPASRAAGGRGALCAPAGVWRADGLISQGLSCLIWICNCDSFRFIEQVPLHTTPPPPTASTPDILIWIIPWWEGQPVLCRGSAASLTPAPTGCQ